MNSTAYRVARDIAVLVALLCCLLRITHLESKVKWLDSEARTNLWHQCVESSVANGMDRFDAIKSCACEWLHTEE
jgi:hypothetical protein